MIVTLLIGIGVALLILGPLIILHEFGHYFAARFFGVKPLEYGFGFPPRITGFWTGSERIRIDADTRFEAGDDDAETSEGAYSGPLAEPADGSPSLTRPEGRVASSGAQVAIGDHVTVGFSEDEHGEKRAMYVRAYERGDDLELQSAGGVTVGKVRSVTDGEIVVRDMLWSINWLPFGGFVRLRGEENPAASDSLAAKSPGARAVILLAGIAVNAVLPFLIFAVVSQIPQEQVVGDVIIREVLPNSPAYEAGLRASYKVLEVDGVAISTIPELQTAVTRRLGAETEWKVLRGIQNPFPRVGEPAVEYLPDEVITMNMVPRWDPPRHDVVEEVSDPETQVRLGVARTYDPRVGISDELTVVRQGGVADSLTQIGLEDAREYVAGAELGDVIPVVSVPTEGGLTYLDARRFDNRLGSVEYLQEGAVGVMLRLESPRVERVSVPLSQALSDGIDRTIEVLVLARNAIGGAISGSNNPQFDAPVAVGPVGISQLSGEVATADAPVESRVIVFLTLAATLSISLAVINVLPIPGLDGGRLLFVVIEVVRGGKRISPEREGLVHFTGFVVLLGLLIAVSVLDVTRIFRGESFF